jgi:hypothetical protein
MKRISKSSCIKSKSKFIQIFSVVFVFCVFCLFGGALDSISTHWEVAALWNQFWWEKSTQNSDFLAILRCSLVAMVTGNLNMGHVVTKAINGSVNICAKCD